MTDFDPTAHDRGFDDYRPARGLTMTQFCRSLARQLEHVASGGLGVIIYRYGRPSAVLVSYEDYELMMEMREFEEQGPIPVGETHRIGRQTWREVRKRLGWRMFRRADQGKGPLLKDTAMRDDVGGR